MPLSVILTCCFDFVAKPLSAVFTLGSQQKHVCCCHSGARHSKTTSAAFTLGPDTAKPRLLPSLRGQTQQNHVCCFHFGAKHSKTTSAAFTSGLVLSLWVYTEFTRLGTAKPRLLLSISCNRASCRALDYAKQPFLQVHLRARFSHRMPRSRRSGGPFFPQEKHIAGPRSRTFYTTPCLGYCKCYTSPGPCKSLRISFFPKNTAIAGPCESFFPQEKCIGFTPHPVRGSAGVHHAGSLRVPSFLTNTAIAGPCGSLRVPVPLRFTP